jgi:hypothetical protein
LQNLSFASVANLMGFAGIKPDDAIQELVGFGTCAKDLQALRERLEWTMK